MRLYKIESRFGAIERRAVSELLAASQDNVGTFRWSRAVRAMSALMVRSLLACLDGTIEPRLSGGQGSLASSLDGALSKEPVWLLDTFGRFPGGFPVSRRLFMRSNPGRKRAGPVAVSLGSRVKAGDIAVYLDGMRIVRHGRLQALLADLESIG